MTPQAPGSPTNPLYNPDSLPVSSGDSLASAVPQTSTYVLSGVTPITSLAGTKHPREDSPEITERKASKLESSKDNEPPSMPEVDEKLLMSKILGLMQSAGVAAMKAAWAIQNLQAQTLPEQGFSTSLTALPPPRDPTSFHYLPPPPPSPQSSPLLYQPIKGENDDYLMEMQPPAPRSVPDWLRSMPSDPMHKSSSSLGIAPHGSTPKPPKTRKPRAIKSDNTLKQGTKEKYELEFKQWAEQLSEEYGKAVSAKELWALSALGPVKASSQYLGDIALNALKDEKRSALCKIFREARERHLQIEKKKMTLEFQPEKTPTPVPPSPASLFSTDTGHSPATVSDTSAFSTSEPPTTTKTSFAIEKGKGKKKAKGIKAAQTAVQNPYKNSCFITSAIHFTRAALPPETIIHISDFKQSSDETGASYAKILRPLSELIFQMKQSEAGVAGVEDLVAEALENLVNACKINRSFDQSIHLKIPRGTRSVVTPATGGVLNQLEHDDASQFFMDLWSTLKPLIPASEKSLLYKQMETVQNGITFTKKGLGGSEFSPFLNVSLSPDGSVQSSINQLFADSVMNGENQILWEKSDAIVASLPNTELPSGYYDSKVRFKLKASDLKRLNLRLELQYQDQGVQRKNDKACQILIDQIFNPVTVPVEDANTEETSQKPLTPNCIVAHCGDDVRSGHYVTLKKTLHGWFLLDNGNPPKLLQKPVNFLHGPPRFDPYLISYDVPER